MAQSMFSDLLKTPQQVRQEEEAALREQSLAQASLLGRNIRGGQTALPSIIAGIASNEMANLAPTMQKSVSRGLLGLSKLAGIPQMPSSTQTMDSSGAVVGQATQPRYGRLSEALRSASMSPGERQAESLSSLADSGLSTDPKAIRAAAEKLRSMGRPDIASQLEERAKSVETAGKFKEMQKGLVQRFINMDRRDLAAMATSAEDMGDLLALTKELRQSQTGEKDKGPKIPSSTEMEQYTLQTTLYKDEEKLIDQITDGSLGFFEGGILSDSDAAIQYKAALKAKAITAAHNMLLNGDAETFEEAYKKAIGNVWKKYTARVEQADKEERKKNTPKAMPGTEVVDPNEGISEDQLNIGGA